MHKYLIIAMWILQVLMYISVLENLIFQKGENKGRGRNFSVMCGVSGLKQICELECSGNFKICVPICHVNFLILTIENWILLQPCGSFASRATGLLVVTMLLDIFLLPLFAMNDNC